MVSVEKHKALLNDKETRVNKRLNKMLLLSNNAKKKDKKENEFLEANIGKHGVIEIRKTNTKRGILIDNLGGILNGSN